MKKQKPVSLSRELRKNQTEAEAKLWTALRNRYLAGVKFRRQEPIGNYIVDFVNFEAGLVIEVDGGHHNEPLTIRKDMLRTQFLESKGYQVLRFWDNDVLKNIDNVLELINISLDSRLHPHLTSPVKGEANRVGTPKRSPLEKSRDA